MNYKMRVIIKRPEEQYGHVTNISNRLENLQKTVEGYIEVVPVKQSPDGKDIILICNEEGKLWGLEPNIFLISGTNVDEVVGPILIVKDAGEEFGELTEEEANMVCERIGGSGIWQM